MGFYLMNALIAADAVCTLQAMAFFVQFCDFTAGRLVAICLPTLGPVCPSSDILVYIQHNTCSLGNLTKMFLRQKALLVLRS